MKTLDLYTADGWINIPAIRSFNCWLNVLIGPRQVGKTYGCLLDQLSMGNQFVYMRRTEEEMSLVTSNEKLNPFLKMKQEGFSIDMVKMHKTYIIGDYETTAEGKHKITNTRGIGLALSSVSKIRGFDGSSFSDLVFDEFIPEKIVVQRRAEGDAFLNAYTTINGNRELKRVGAHPPLKVWLLANANNLDSPIITALRLSKDIEHVIRTGKEYLIKNGVFLAMPKSESVIEERKETALMRHLRGIGEFYGMAIENKFSYDSLDMVRPKSIKGMKPLMSIGNMYIWDNGSSLYICGIPHRSREMYGTTPEDSIRVGLIHPELRMCYNFGYISFDSSERMFEFKKFMNIKD